MSRSTQSAPGSRRSSSNLVRWARDGAPRIALAALLLVGASSAPARGSDVDLSRLEGHPRGRFPLAIHVAAFGHASLDAAARRAVDDWNALGRSALGMALFTELGPDAEAQILMAVEPAESPRLMGQTSLEADAGGVIQLPVRVVVFQPRARGATAVDVVAYEVVAHELGHALGLPHTTDPRSIMCCIEGSVDFADPAQRQAYVQARRHPDVFTAERQLVEHYRRFWSRP